MDLLLTGKIVAGSTLDLFRNVLVHAVEADAPGQRVLAMGKVVRSGDFAVAIPSNVVEPLIERGGSIGLIVMREGEVVRLEAAFTWTRGQSTDGIELVTVVDRSGGDAEGTRTVYGRATLVRDGSPAAGLVVRAFDRDLRGEQLLGEAITARNGRYSIGYRRDQFARAEKETADLQIRVFAGDGRKQLFQSSLEDTRFNAGTNERIDARIAGLAEPGGNQFDRLTQALAAPLDGLSPSELTETPNQPDITFLARESRIDPNQIEHFVLAHRLGAAVGVEPAAFYALLRQDTLLAVQAGSLAPDRYAVGIGEDTETLLFQAALIPAETIAADIRTAIKRAIVARAIKDETAALIEALKPFAEKAKAREPNAVKLLEQQARRLFVQPQRIAQIAELFAGRNLDFPKLVALLGVDETDTAATPRGDELKPMLPGLDRVVAAAGLTSDPAKLAALPRATWLAALKAGDSAVHDDSRLAIHADRLARAAEMQSPAAAIRARIERGEFGAVDKKAFNALLKRRKDGRDQDLDLATAQLDQEFDLTELRPIERKTLARLQQTQRMLRIAPDLDRAGSLIDQGIASASAVVAAGKARFVGEIAPAAGMNQVEAERAYARAATRHDAALLLAGELKSLGAAAPAATMGFKNHAVTAAASFPSVATLFGPGNPCHCENCRSVYSPAAYLVELIEFIARRGMVDLTQSPPVKVNLAREIVFERRPELAEIDLNCANAEVPLPYIDLVCELLEEQVSPDAGVAFVGPLAAGVIPAALFTALAAAGWPVSEAAIIQPADSNGNMVLRDAQLTARIQPSGGNWRIIRTRQTHGTPEELSAAPEYVNQAAYAKLKTGTFAFALPFDLDHAEASAYFERFGLKRADLMRDLGTSSGPSAIEIAYDGLGIAASEGALLIAPTAAQDAVWGPPGGDPVADMTNVKVMLDKTGLTYEALNRLLQLAYIDPADTLFVRHLDLSCDLDAKEVAGLDSAALDRIHRFLRLKRATGWSDEILDAAITQTGIGGANLDGPALVAIEQVKRLAGRTGLKVEELTACFGAVPHAEFTGSTSVSFYARTFLNKATLGAVDERLAVATVAAETGTIAPLAQVLATVLKLSADDFVLLADRLTDDVLSFKNLSRLYGAARLVVRLKLKAADLVILLDRTAIDPFESPAKLLAFLDEHDRVKAGPVKFADTPFVLEHAGADLPIRAASDLAITTALTGLQTVLQTAWLATHPVLDPGATAEELRTPLSETLQRLPGWTAAASVTVLRMYDAQWLSPPDPAAAGELALLFGQYFDSSGLAVLQAAVAAAAPAGLEAAQLAFGTGIIAAIASYLYAAEQRTAVDNAVAAFARQPVERVALVIDRSRLVQPGPAMPLLRTLLSADALIDPVNLPPVPPAITALAFADQFAAMRMLHKLLPLTAATGLSDDDLGWVLDNAAGLGWVALDQIPYDAAHAAIGHDDWQTLARSLALFKAFAPVADPADPAQPVTLALTLNLVLPGATTTRAQWLDALALLTGFDRTVLDALDAHFSWSAANLDLWRKPAVWEQLQRCMRHLATLGVDVATAVNLTIATLTPSDTAALRTALKSRYADDIWLSTLGEIMNVVRSRKRDALVAWLLGTRPEWVTTTDLYDHFLIDTQMEAKMPSSRIVQAHGTIQLFVERSRMGLEPRSAADSSDTGWKQWIWMRSFQVWVANRKIFVTPENWIRPELLDDKSSQLQMLEDELLQNEVNEFTTEEAYIRYLERLDEISFLEVITVFYEAAIKTLHVFARTKGGDPAQYFHRKLEHERYWTPWVLVELDITNDALLAFSRNGRLQLAWPVCHEETDPDQEATTPAVSGTSSTGPMQNPAARLHVQLAVSEYANGQWKPRKISQDAILSPSYYTTNKQLLNASGFNLLYNAFSDQIWMFVTDVDGDWEAHSLKGKFSVTGCKGYPEVIPDTGSYLPDFFPDYKDSHLKRQRYFELGGDGADTLAIRNMITFWDFVVRLGKTPGKFRVTHAHQLTLVDMVYILLQLLLLNATGGKSTTFERGIKLPLGTWMPYFYEDSERAYIVVPGLYSKQGLASEQRTFSDFHALIERVLALFAKYTALLGATPAPDPAAVWDDFVHDPETIAIFDEIKLYFTLQFGEEFRNLYHPLLCPLRLRLYRTGAGEMTRRESQLLNTGFDFKQTFAPTAIITQPYPVEDVDFSPSGSYSLYNWELFFHAPLMIARRLVSEQRFEEAMVWFHRIFDPTGTLDGAVPQKYWVTRPFFETTAPDYAAQQIETLLTTLSDPASPDRHALELAVEDWRNKPFRPHVVARFRSTAYQRTVVMNYVEALTEWGDFLFRQDTMESITQATQRYILAEKLLGPKPRVVPNPVDSGSQTYAQLVTDLDAFGNALVALENYLPDLSILPEGGAELASAPPATLASLYFCVPPNEKMLAVWDTVGDRLFKIRNSQNIDGVERLLSLFAPPIDPDMLVKAAAAGLDLSAVIAGLNAPRPGYRFQALVAQADEFTALVERYGSALQVALEKRDAEALGILRSDLEEKLLKAQRTIKTLAVDAANQEISALDSNKAVTVERVAFYAAFEQINAHEQLNLDKMESANDFQKNASIVRATGAVLGIIPDIAVGAHGAGGSPAIHASFGGSTLAHVADAAAAVLTMKSGTASYEASRAAALGSIARRGDEAGLQARTGALELAYIEQQLATARIRLNLASKDLAAHDLQIENSGKLGDALRDKFTSQALFQWAADDVVSIYYRAYQLAFAVAKKAERCLQFELGSTETFLAFGYWNSRKKGLQAANKLAFDIKRMKAHYFDANKREYELTKHVSLRRLDPLALLKLKTTGSCTFEIPEALYDLDHPGHHFRRIKSVSITLPCVAGPYSSVSAKLTQLSNRYRNSTASAAGAGTPQEEYEEAVNDTRFIYNATASQSIATSSGQNDPGLFELSFSDDRYLPFEGSGAIGSWRLELPDVVRQFDYDSISDAIVHVRYTAREGGSRLRGLASSTLLAKLMEIRQDLAKTGMHTVIDLKRDHFDLWHELRSTGSTKLTVPIDRLPYFLQDTTPTMGAMTVLAKVTGDPASFDLDIGGATLALGFSAGWRMNLNEVAGPGFDTELEFAASAPELIEELAIVFKIELP